ncbi:MAG: phosphoribosylaminoimidazolesuccinocarboxamide synthase [Planctomycetota bacterium]
MGNAGAVFQTDLDLPCRRGKVRDVYELPGDRVMLVASDRLSAFDVVLPTPIPGKGRLLTGIAAFWLRWIESRGICRTFLTSTDARDVPETAFAGVTSRDDLEGRIAIGAACRVLPIECVVRGYLEGSGWAEYEQTGAVCGVPLPSGLARCDRLPEPIFTPATKAEQGAHDENIDETTAAELVGRERFDRVRSVSLEIYRQASTYALERGIIIADTKFEFGVPVGSSEGDDGKRGAEPILIDEALTPDSSRFWPADSYRPGGSQPSFDKQFVREHLLTMIERGEWDRTDPGPELPADVVRGTIDRYAEARDRLLGKSRGGVG